MTGHEAAWPVAERTKGPWTAHEYASPRGIAYIVAANGEKVVSGPSLVLEDAQFIVKACNAYEALTKALSVDELPDPNDYGENMEIFIADIRAWRLRNAAIINEVQS